MAEFVEILKTAAVDGFMSVGTWVAVMLLVIIFLDPPYVGTSQEAYDTPPWGPEERDELLERLRGSLGALAADDRGGVRRTGGPGGYLGAPGGAAGPLHRR